MRATNNQLLKLTGGVGGGVGRLVGTSLGKFDGEVDGVELGSPILVASQCSAPAAIN